jgi:hypothetical protein
MLIRSTQTSQAGRIRAPTRALARTLIDPKGASASCKAQCGWPSGQTGSGSGSGNTGSSGGASASGSSPGASSGATAGGAASSGTSGGGYSDARDCGCDYSGGGGGGAGPSLTHMAE